MPFYRPAAMAQQVVPDADVLLITGATLLNDTLETCWDGPGRARVTVVGPTVGMLPDPFLARASICSARSASPTRTASST